MVKLSVITQKMLIAIGITALILMGCSVAYYRSWGFIPFALGVLLGSLLNVVKIISLERAVDKSLTMDPMKAANYIRLHYLLRFLLTGAVLAAAALVPFIGLWGAAAGVLTMQVAVFSTRFTHQAVE